MFNRYVLAAGLAVIAAAPATAAIITPGFTFAVAGDGGSNLTGNHYHSNTGGSFGNPAGKAEVGRFGSEEVRGLSEYDLTGLSASPTAFVTFNVFKKGGLFDGVNDTPFTGTIAIYAYVGNNLENLSDYEAPSIGTIATFAVDPSVNVGDVFSFDITSTFNAVVGSQPSLGIRLQAVPLNGQSQAWTFDNFRLTSDNQTTGGVPEPTTWAMMIVGFGAVGVSMRRRQRVRVSFA